MGPRGPAGRSTLGTAAIIAVAFGAGLHLVFFAPESFSWDKPLGRKVLGMARSRLAPRASSR